jgi:hypothetical protein
VRCMLSCFRAVDALGLTPHSAVHGLTIRSTAPDGPLLVGWRGRTVRLEHYSNIEHAMLSSDRFRSLLLEALRSVRPVPDPREPAPGETPCTVGMR